MELMLKVLADLQSAGEFKPMSDTDYMGFAGAEEGALIAYGTLYTFILEPSSDAVVAVNNDTGSEFTLEVVEAAYG
jgi:hypothetical protein